MESQSCWGDDRAQGVREMTEHKGRELRPNSGTGIEVKYSSDPMMLAPCMSKELKKSLKALLEINY